MLHLRGFVVAFAAFISASGCAMFSRGPKDNAIPKPDVAATTAAEAKSAAGSSTATPAELAAIMSEVQQLGALDPAAQNALLEDLKRTDPSLWPQLVQTFRTSIAFHHQQEERARLAAQGQGANSVLASQQYGKVRPVGYVDNAPRPLPATSDGVVPPAGPPPSFAANYPSTGMSPVSLGGAPQPSPPRPDDWHDQLHAAIRAMELKAASSGAQPTATDQATLRMLYLAAGRRDEALRPLTGTAGAEQEFWGEELFGLATALDAERLPDAQRRAAEAAAHFREAAGKLSQSASLALRNLVFCTEVLSYGVYKPFAKYEFKPGEEVILYAEVENFTSDVSDKGYRTALKGSYQILDSRGTHVVDQQLDPAEEICRNPRRDYFVRYKFNLPTRIYNGNYTLRLSVEDTLGKKIGQSSIQFTIVGAD